MRMPSCAYFFLTSTYLRKRPAKSEEKKISYGCKAYRPPGDKDSVRSVCLRLTQTHIESRIPSPLSRLGLQSTSDPRPPNVSQHVETASEQAAAATAGHTNYHTGAPHSGTREERVHAAQ